MESNVIDNCYVAFSTINPPQSNNIFQYNYYNCPIGWTNANNIFTDNTVVAAADWPSAAQDIIRFSGIEMAYRDIVPPILEPENVAQNPGFETGTLNPWESQPGLTIVGSDAHSGAYAGRIDSAGIGFTQNICGLCPSTKYTFAGWAKCPSGGEAVLGALNYGGTQIEQRITNATYAQATLTFTTGPATTNVRIFGKSAGLAGPVFVDDFTVREEPLKWVGSVSGVWDSNAANWSGQRTQFTNGDRCFFGDEGSNKAVIIAAGGVRPAGVTIAAGPDGNYTFSGDALGGAGGLTMSGYGSLTLAGINTFTGPTLLNSGVLRITSDERSLGANPPSANAGQLTFQGGTLRVASSFTVDDTNRGVTLGAESGTIIVDSNCAFTLSRPITGLGGLTKRGSGTLILTASNEYGGETLIRDGVLQIRNAFALGPKGARVTSETAQLQLMSGDGMTIDEPITINDSWNDWKSAWNGDLTAPGTLYNVSGSNTISAPVIVGIDGVNARILVDGASLTLKRGITSADRGWARELILQARNGNLIVDGPISLGEKVQLKITNCTNGNWVVLNDTNDYENAYVFWFGRLKIGRDNALPSRAPLYLGTDDSGCGPGWVDLNGHSVTVAGLISRGSNSWESAITNSGAAATLFIVDSGTGTNDYKFALNGNLALLKDGSGTQSLSGANTYTGNTTVNGGILSLVGKGSISNSAVITIAAGAALDVSARTEGGLTLCGSQTLTGDGRVTGNVTMAAGSILAPGRGVGTLRFDNDLETDAGAQLNFELGPTNDNVIVRRNLALRGTLNIQGLAGFSNGIYRLFDYDGALIANELAIGSAPAGYMYTIDTSRPQQVNLTVTRRSATTLYVRADSPSSSPPYASWNTAAHDIQSAVDAAVDGDTVLVTNGVYATGGRTVETWLLTNRVVIDKPITVRSVNGPAVTRIEGSQDAATTNGDAAARCVWLGNGASLIGFTLADGATRATGDMLNEQGGGGALVMGMRLMSNCWIVGCSAREGGGGVEVLSATGKLTHCRVAGNRAASGGGLFVGWSTAVLENCRIVSNYASWGGGGLTVSDHADVRNCLVVGNRAVVYGGGLLLGNYANVYQCTLEDNDNETAGLGDGVCFYGDHAGLYGSIVYFNGNENIGEYAGDVCTNREVKHCCTTVAPPVPIVEHLITNAPAYRRNRAAGDFHLAAGSPCIDAGANLDWMAGATDLDGLPRVSGVAVDLGAYEYADNDDDGLPDWWELQYGLVPTNATDGTLDKDGDSFSNLEEYRDGADPADPLSVPVHEYYVSPAGCDTNVGAQWAPFQTIECARAAMRSNMADDIVVWIGGGRYTITNTITFNSEDSGTAEHPVVYRAFPGEHPVISGGQRITGWTLHDPVKNIYKASVGAHVFRQLYVDGKRAIRARAPNLLDEKTRGPYYTAVSATPTFIVDTNDLGHLGQLDTGHLNQVECVWLSQWQEKRARIQSFSTSGSQAQLAFMRPEADAWPYYFLFFPQNPTYYYFENAYEFLDAEGEWYLDTATGTLYYKPRGDENLPTAEIIVPGNLETLMKFEGNDYWDSSTDSAGVHDIQINGLTFEYSTWMDPSDYGYYVGQPGGPVNSTSGHWLPGMVQLRFAHHIRFERNTLRHSGAHALSTYYRTYHNEIIGNFFTDLSGGAVVLDIARIPGASRHDLIANNFIEKCGRDYADSVGIFASWPYALIIEHNEIQNLPEGGINVGWPVVPLTTTNNEIRYNKVHDIAQCHADGGGVYSYGPTENERIHHNYCANIHKSPWSGHYGIMGIYLDNFSQGITVESNVIDNCYVAFGAVNPPQSNNILQYNYYNCPTGWIDTNNTFTDNTAVTDADWPPAAQDIIRSSGIEAAYRDIVPAILEPENIVQNPGFETGTLDPWESQPGLTLVDSDVRSGAYAGRIDSAGAGFYQNIGGLRPGTKYTFTGWAKCPSGGQAVLGALNYGGTQIEQRITNATYAQATLTFTTGPATTNVRIFGKSTGLAAPVFVDDFTVREEPLKWVGSVSGVWDSNAANWSGQRTQFTNGDRCFFGDEGSNKAVIITAGGVSPAGVTVATGPEGHYTFNGGALSGAGGLTMSGYGSLTLAGINTFTGPTLLNSGVLRITSDEGALGANPGSFNASQLKLDGGALRASATFTIDDANRGITLGDGGGTIIVDLGSTLTISVPVTGPGGLIKSGGGTLILSVSNSFEGETLIREGNIEIQNSHALGSATRGLRITDDTAQLRLNSATGMTIDEPITINFRHSSDWTGPLVNVRGANTCSAPITIGGISWEWAGRIWVEGTSLTLKGGISGIDQCVDLAARDGSLVVDGPIDLGTNGWLQIVDSIQWVELNATNICGLTHVFMSGKLKIGRDNILPPGAPFYLGEFTGMWRGPALVDLNGHCLTIGGLISLGERPWDTVITNNWGSLITNSGSPATLTIAGVTDCAYTFPLVGNLSLVKTGPGTQTLSGTNTYPGATTISNGALRLSGDGSLSNSVAIDIAAGAVLDVSGHNGGGISLVAGQTLAGDGRVTGNVTMAAGSILAPGRGVGTLSFENDLKTDAGAQLNFELGSQKDAVAVHGNLSLRGMLNIQGLAGFGSGTYKLCSYDGTLAAGQLTIGSAPTGYTYKVDTSQPYQVNLTVAAYQLSASSGPYSGGNSITITNGTLGNGTDITNVLVGGVAATIEAQGANWVRITMPAHNMGIVDIVVQSASVGEIMLTGAYTYTFNTSKCAADDGFDPTADNAVWCLAVQTDGRLLAGGAFTNLGGQACSRLGRLLVDGSLDTTFLGEANSNVYALVAQTNGQILVGGDFTTLGGQPRNYLGRLNADGTPDATTFNLGANAAVWCLAEQTNGQILVGGKFTTLGGQTRNYLARLNADGSLDTTFTSGANGIVRSLAVQADGKIVVGGAFTNLAGQTHNYLGRLNSDGSLDTTFTNGANDMVNSLAVQVDDKIVVGGAFTNLGGVRRMRLARLNADGSPDTTFTNGADGSVCSLAVQADGKIVVGGAFTMLAGQARSRLARLNFDGSLDTTFTKGANTNVYALAQQPDGGILVGGAFTNLAGQARRYIGRFYLDGSLDMTVTNGVSQCVECLLTYDDGKILVGGQFTTLGGQTRINMGCLKVDGSLVTNFSSLGANSAVYGFVAQPDGKILVGGEFGELLGQTRNYLGRLNADYSLDTTFTNGAGTVGVLL